MARKLEEIADEALALNVEGRAALAKRLLDSLEELSPEEHERLWADEAESRYEALRTGSLHSIPVEDVLAKLESRRRG
jgi:putative addiction module component (TIGR02574 family)